MRRTHRRMDRGMTLIEAMIALAVLLIGILGMLKLQVYGMSATQGARSQTVATQLATELAGALSRLPIDDGRISGAAGADDVTPPATFGSLLADPSATGVHLHAWSDASPIPGARSDASIERDPADPTQPLYRRRWTVWNVGSTAAVVPAKVIAVSVIFRERTVARPREIVVLAHNELPNAFMANVIGLR